MRPISVHYSNGFCDVEIFPIVNGLKSPINPTGPRGAGVLCETGVSFPSSTIKALTVTPIIALILIFHVRWRTCLK